MRCVGCHADLLTPEHYCECCGRKLSLEESSPETAPITIEAEQDQRGVGRTLRSCGGPTADGDGDICGRVDRPSARCVARRLFRLPAIGGRRRRPMQRSRRSRRVHRQS